jgi:predicted proteasome-type protease
MSGKIIAQKKNQRLTVRTEIWNTKSGEGIKAVVRNPNGTFDGATNQTRFFKMPESKVIEKIVEKTITVQAPRKKILGLF